MLFEFKIFLFSKFTYIIIITCKTWSASGVCVYICIHCSTELSSPDAPGDILHGCIHSSS